MSAGAGHHLQAITHQQAGECLEDMKKMQPGRAGTLHMGKGLLGFSQVPYAGDTTLCRHMDLSALLTWFSYQGLHQNTSCEGVH